jgi:hypothetical protein
MGKLRALGVVGLKNVVALWLTLAYAIGETVFFCHRSIILHDVSDRPPFVSDLREVTSKLISQVLPAVLAPSGDLDRLRLYFRTLTVLLRWHHEQSLDCTQISTLLRNCMGNT